MSNQSISVQWERPLVIGRDDFYYILEYSDGGSVTSRLVINQSEVVSQVITGLKGATDYRITVTVVNGVSVQESVMCEVVATTLEGGILLQ